jgi:nicotinate-nucleotide adenylyltransferase
LNIALFGGTFDPVHAGHLRAAAAAARQFRLERVLFIPSGNPPHKVNGALTSFAHRFAMVTLACAGDERFVPSLLEAPAADGRIHYSLTTTEKVKRSIGAEDHLYFLVGVDAFLDLRLWKGYRRLLDLVNFIVVSRPGFSDADIAGIVPPEMIRSGGRSVSKSEPLNLRKTTLHILRGVNAPAASHKIRAALRAGGRVTGLVPPLVEEYIVKEGLYRPGRPGPIG